MILRVELVLTGARVADATKAEKITNTPALYLMLIFHVKQPPKVAYFITPRTTLLMICKVRNQIVASDLILNRHV